MTMKGQCILCLSLHPLHGSHTYVLFCIVEKNTFFFEIFLSQTWTFKGYIIKCIKERKLKLF